MSLQLDYLVRKEQYQDLIRQASQDGLVEIAKQQRNQPATHRQVVGWLGAQMVKWGGLLQNYATSSAANVSRANIQME